MIFNELGVGLQCVPGESGLRQKYAFIKKSTIFTQSRLSGKYKKFEKSGSSRLISFFGQNGTKNH